MNTIFRIIAVCLLAVCASAPLRAGETQPVSAAGTSLDADERRENAPPVAEPETYRTDDYRKPVPATLKGAIVLSNAAALALWKQNRAVFIDVYPHAPKPDKLPPGILWRETTHQSIENAVWLANVGYGVLSDATDRYFRAHLERLSGSDKAKPLVFFCLKDCWMSWNAAKRAISYGYSAVHWYPEGSDGWQEIGQLVQDLAPVK